MKSFPLLAPLLATVVGLLTFAGCEGNPFTASDRAALEGEYSGSFFVTFHVGTDSAKTETGPVTLALQDGRYQVDGERRYYPPRGGGKYEVSDKIDLTDLEIHTTEFDPSLILNGPFGYKLEEGTLTLTQHQKTRDRYRKLVVQRVE